ncbi:TPM domain-containing protein [Pedobacter cryotolerans]|uniref:TPM domain-containing protein n=1 Tax=Pedobacter cryotolerans TaxID=2571270 RepID=A0A4U1BZ99_9SPHI|nr:TPM domain-containing protein [Pedobacter cryotolerans]TKB98100.1 TPM domain-containing protein [Pedobacter cryotolerans]
MKKIIILSLLTLSTFLGFAQEFPAKPNKLVNDYTNTLTSEQIQSLERKLVAFDDSTSNQIAVVIMKSVGDYDINEYAQKLGRAWGVGGKEKNNGVVLLVAMGDRKLSIQTGYGVEGALPDIYTKRIIENDIKPFFKTNDYYAGIDAGTNSIIELIKGEYKNDNPKAKSKGSKSGAGFIVIIIIIVIVIILRKGGGGGGGNQVIGGRGVADALFWSMLLGGGRGSGGGGFGGGFGGGSSGGGGFGGFGGGSFGGGGSSGSW